MYSPSYYFNLFLVLNLLKATTTHFLGWNLKRINRCLDELTEEQVWQRPNENSLSVGNQVLHLCGNIRQWVLTGMGGAPDVRQRAEEFSARGGVDKAMLRSMLITIIQESADVIDGLTAGDLLAEREVQGFRHHGVFILMHITEHLSYHTGQVVFWTKALKDIDLDLYAGLDLGVTS